MFYFLKQEFTNNEKSNKNYCKKPSSILETILKIRGLFSGVTQSCRNKCWLQLIAVILKKTKPKPNEIIHFAKDQIVFWLELWALDTGIDQTSQKVGTGQSQQIVVIGQIERANHCIGQTKQTKIVVSARLKRPKIWFWPDRRYDKKISPDP